MTRPGCQHGADAAHAHDDGGHDHLTPEQEEAEERKALGRHAQLCSNIHHQHLVHIRIAAALRQYPEQAEWELQRWRYNYDVLPTAHKAILPHLPAKFAAAKDAARTNTHFFKV